jgi:hypothetical protein
VDTAHTRASISLMCLGELDAGPSENQAVRQVGARYSGGVAELTKCVIESNQHRMLHLLLTALCNTLWKVGRIWHPLPCWIPPCFAPRGTWLHMVCLSFATELVGGALTPSPQPLLSLI